MPHKHKRKRDNDVSNFDLAPTSRAKPLAAYTKASIFSPKTDDGTSNKRRKPNGLKKAKPDDDTPKAFARLMAWQATGKRPNGLDDGTKPAKKKQAKKPQSKSLPADSSIETKTHNSESSAQPQPKPTSITPHTIPKILPGETLSSFSLRVDQSLPLAASTSTSAPGTLPADLASTLKRTARTTKHNRRLQRMQADWRSTEAKLRDAKDADLDENEDKIDEEQILWAGVRAARNDRKGKKKRAGGAGKDDDDPWKELERKRKEEAEKESGVSAGRTGKTRGRGGVAGVGVTDVVKAPPVLKTVKSKFKIRAEDLQALEGRGKGKKSGGGGAVDGGDGALVDVKNVPNAVGSLRRREELNVARRAVIDEYRNMRSGRKRGVGERLALSKGVTV